jgi:hypothetical protein
MKSRQAQGTMQVGLDAVTLICPLQSGGLAVGDRAGRLSLLLGDDWAWSQRLAMPNAHLAKLYFVRSVAEVADSRLLVAISGASVWGLDAQTGDILWRKRSPFHWGFFPSRPSAAATGKEGEVLVSYDDGRMEVFAPGGQVAARWHDSESPLVLRTSEGVIVGSGGYNLGVWDVESRSRVSNVRLRDRVVAFDAAAQAPVLAIARHGAVDCRHAVTGEARSFDWPVGLPAVAVSPDAKTLALTTAEGYETVDVESGVREAFTVEQGRVSALAFGADGVLWSGTSRGSLGWLYVG